MFTGEPCDKWPPFAKLKERTVSPGFKSAKNTAKLAFAPLCG